MLIALAVFFLFFLPFQFALQPTSGVDLAVARVIAIGIFCIFLIQGFLKKHIVLPRPLPLFFFMAFLFWSSISFLWAENREWSVRKIAFLLSFFPLFIVFSSLLRYDLKAKLFRGLVMGAIVSALLALLLFFSQFIFGVASVFDFWIRDVLPFFLGQAFGGSVAYYPSLLVNIAGNTMLRVSLFFPDPHMASFFFGMAIPPALFLAQQSVGWQRVVWLSGALFLLLADVLTFSRGGYVGLFFGGSVLFFAVYLRYGFWEKKVVYSVFISVVIGILFLISPIGTRFLSSFSYDDGSNIERVRLWQEAIASIERHPLLGVGLGNYPLDVKPSAVYREPIYAHNLFLDIAVETGLIGLGFFVALFFFCVVSAWRRWRLEDSFFHLTLCVSLVLFFAHSLFETPLFSVHILPVLLLFLAASLTPTRVSAVVNVNP